MSAPNEHAEYTRVFARVFCAELDYVQSRRERLGLDTRPLVRERQRLHQILRELGDRDPDTNPDRDRDAPRVDVRPSSDAGLVGLALSGGGIRSATFNLGLLQALAKRGILRYCDYLSTVSGGGYIGSCLSSLLDNPDTSVEEANFPFRFERDKDPDERKEVKWLRRFSNYLAPDKSIFGWDVWRMIGMYLSGLVLTNVVPFSVGLLIAYGIHLIVVKVTAPLQLARMLLLGSLGVFGVMVIVRWLATLRNLGHAARRVREYVQAYLAAVVAFLGALSGLITLAYYLPAAKSEAYNLLHGVSLASLVGLLTGLVKSESKWVQRLLGGVFRIAWIAVLPVLFAELLRWLWITRAFETSVLGLPWPIVVSVLLLLVSLTINTNRISLHHFYRDRLSEAYIIKRVQKSDGPEPVETIVSNEPLTMARLHAHPNGAPYHLINVTLNVPDTRDRYLRGRGADLFVFSKLYGGAESTGYRRTDHYEKGETRLATAMAISGAAASPQMGTSTSPILTFLMTLLNVRLNRWMPNPRLKHAPMVTLWPYYFFKELLRKTKETDSLLNLSDGGHHENLGFYMLIMRGCRYIIASDAAADPDFAMKDLANLFRKVRIDFGVDVDMDLSGLRPGGGMRYTPQHYAVGKIRYPDGKKGVLVYIKSSLTGREPEDLLAYRRRNPSFPDESTADQFFDEPQFESYRKLGDLTGREVFSQEEVFATLKRKPDEEGFLDEFFQALERRYREFCARVGQEGQSKRASA